MRILIEEGISPIVYHFCPLSTMLQIAETDTFKLSSTYNGKYDSDLKMNSFPTGNGGAKIYPYYMCFSRTPLSLVGYQYMRSRKSSGEWGNALVRMEIDGTALNANFKGAPVNFFTEKDPLGGEPKFDASGKPIKSNGNGNLGNKYEIGRSWIIPRIPNSSKSNIETFEMPRVNRNVDYADIVRTRMSEYEDRIYSNNDEIKPASRYIKRIDILLNDTSINNKYNIAVINNIYQYFNNYAVKYNTRNAIRRNNGITNRNLQTFNAPPIFIYTNKISFNSLNIKDAITPIEFGKRHTPYANGETFFKGNDGFMDVVKDIPNNDMGAIFEIMTAIAFTPNFTIEQFDNNLSFLIKKLELNNWKTYDGIKDYSNLCYQKCHQYLNNFDTYYYYKVKGRFAPFNTWPALTNAYCNKHGGDKTLMSLYNKAMALADYDCENFALKYNTKKTGIFTTLKKKVTLFLNNTKDMSLITNFNAIKNAVTT